MREIKFETKVLLRNENVERYRVEIARFDTNNEESIESLIAKAQNGSIAARNKVVESNLKLVWSIAKLYMGMGLDFEDLVQEGNMGLISAISSFDESKECVFATWALQYIRKYITAALTDYSRTIRMNKAQLAEKRNYACASMDKPLGEDGDNYGDTFADTSLAADSTTKADDMKVYVRLLMQGLTDREKAVIIGLFGLDGCEETPYTLATRYQLTETRVLQIKREALEKMQGFKKRGLN